MGTSQPQLLLFLWSVCKNVVMITDSLQEDYIANPNPSTMCSRRQEDYVSL
jgi:hypothetical protein